MVVGRDLTGHRLARCISRPRTEMVAAIARMRSMAVVEALSAMPVLVAAIGVASLQAGAPAASRGHPVDRGVGIP